MRTLTSRGTVGVVVAVLLALLTGCGGSGQKSASNTTSTTPSLATRTAKSGPVAVKVTPRGVDASGARFSVDLDNHAVDLTGDYAKTSTLTVAGNPWAGARWTGAGPGGHHRSGTLTFAAGGPASGAVELRLGGLPTPVTLRWTLPAG